MADNKDKKVLNVPALRFPEFTDEWNKYLFDDIAQYKKGPFGSALKKEIFVPESNDTIKIYEQQNAIKKDWKLGRYFISKDYFINHMQQFVVKAGDIIVSCAGTIGEMYELPQNAISGVFNQALMRVRVNTDLIDKNIFIEVFSSMINTFSKIYSNGSAIKNIPPFADLKRTVVFIPMKNEQEKISKFISLIDERIATQNKIIEKLQSLIKGIRHNVFQQLRKDVGFNSTIGDILSFEQPQRYIVSSTEYSDDSSCTPVLTANKAFILGYTTETDGIYSKGDCIIVDDFTLDCKYVSFPFKIKSSAIKILTAENKYILRYIYECLKSLDISTEEHKRHYITEIQPSSCILPDDKTLTTIALMFESITNKLENEQSLALMLNKQKQYLLSKMFI